jgi:uncharacterized membrane protein YjjP (DUF1212 family)
MKKLRRYYEMPVALFVGMLMAVVMMVIGGAVVVGVIVVMAMTAGVVMMIRSFTSFFFVRADLDVDMRNAVSRMRVP